MTAKSSNPTTDIDRIIWISDIHLKAKSEKGSNADKLIKKFSEVFKKKILSLPIDRDKITYVIVTGDISFSSENDQYRHVKSFCKALIPEEYHQSIKFIWCCGNHDASWEKFELNFHRLGANLSDFFDDRNTSFNETFGGQEIDFDKIFENYSEHLAYKNNDSHPMFYIKDDNDIKVSERYYKTGLEGQVIDHRQKTIFTVINSAWFSRGHSLHKFIQDFGKGNGLSSEEQLKLIEESQESGKLITGLLSENGKQNAEDLITILTDAAHNDYFKVTLMHHPISWLDPREIHSYDPNLQGKGTILTQILKASSVLLTGHVHPSRANRIEYLYDLGLVHLRAPMLLNHYSTSEKNVSKLFPCNGFGMFAIDRRTRKFNLQYYDSYYAYDSFAIKKSTETPSTSYVKATENIDKTLGYPENEINFDVLYANVDVTEHFDVQEFMMNKSLKNQPTSSTNVLNIYEIESPENAEVLVCPKDKDSCIELSTMENGQFDIVIEMIKKVNTKKKVSKLTVIVPGTYLGENHAPQDKHFNEAQGKSMVLGMLKDADKILNRLRTNFYNYIDQVIDEDDKIQVFFRQVEQCHFNVAMMKSKWFRAK